MTLLETPRLRLRPWRDTDYAPFAALNADPEIMHYFPTPLSQCESDALAERLRAELDRRGWGFWALEDRATAAFIGFTGLQPVQDMPFPDGVEIGWRLARPCWGRGLAYEAATAALAFAFESLALKRVISFTAKDNWRSRRLMARLGLTDTGHTFAHPRLPATSPLSEHVLYALAGADWRAGSRPVRDRGAIGE